MKKMNYYSRKSGNKVYKCVNKKDKSVKFLDSHGKEYERNEVVKTVFDEDAYWNLARNQIALRMMPAMWTALSSPNELAKASREYADALVKELRENSNI